MNEPYFKDGDNELSLNNILSGLNISDNYMSLTVCPCLGTEKSSFEIKELPNGIYCTSLKEP